MTHQEDKWSGSFGKSYADRNPKSAWDMDKLYTATYGVTRSALNWEVLIPNVGVPLRGENSTRILEVGCGLGCQLALLAEMGFDNLYGIDLQAHPGADVNQRTTLNLMRASALDIPFKSGFFDLVFTSGLLIHISPKDLPRAMAEIHRCSRRWIWGMEYYAETLTDIVYRGERDLLWKGPYAQLYLEACPDLELVCEKKLCYKAAPEAQDRMFLLRKKS